MRFTIGRKLAVGFGSMITLIAAVAVVVHYEAGIVTHEQEVVLGDDVPASFAALELRDDIHGSLSELRGWMLDEKPAHKEHRAAIWKKIDKHYGELANVASGYSKTSALSEDLGKYLDEARVAQQRVESVVGSEENFPAASRFDREFTPRVQAMLGAVSAMIDEEKTLEATAERKAMLAVLADCRASLVSANAAMRRFVTYGRDADADEFDQQWAANAAGCESLSSDSDLLTGSQATAFAEYEAANEPLKTIAAEVMGIRRSNDWNVAAHLLETQAEPRAERALEAIEKIHDAFSAKLNEESAMLASSTQLLSTLVVASSGAACFLGCLIAWWITRSVTRPLNQQRRMLQDIADNKDLTRRVEVSTSDEFAELARCANEMASQFEDAFQVVRRASDEVDGGAAQIADSSQSLSEGASEQAASLEQISSSLEEMSGMTQQSATNARQAADLSEESASSADRGQNEMAEMSTAMNEIKASSSEISNIIKVIDEIAFQTNLLALNAAVEAARAGEAGKGFAVVAEEVRNLAQRSAEAAKNTNAMIEESTRRADNGVAIAARVGEALEEIVGGTRRVNGLLGEIASAASEQADGINQVARGVSELDRVTQHNAGNSEELASAAQVTATQVSALRDLVAQFRIGSGSTASDSGRSFECDVRDESVGAAKDQKPVSESVKVPRPDAKPEVGAKPAPAPKAPAPKAEAPKPVAAAAPASSKQAEDLIPFDDDDDPDEFFESF